MKIYTKPPLVLPYHNIPYIKRGPGGSSRGQMWPRFPKTALIVFFVLIFGIGLTFLNVYQLQNMQEQHWQRSHNSEPQAVVKSANGNRRIVWVKAKNEHGGYLDHVFQVFKALGFAEGGNDSEWDVLWHHDYPFLDPAMKPILLNLRPHQKVNHVPGSGYYTSKVNLATSNVSGVPPAFGLPESKDVFLDYAKKNPDKFWVQKDNRHRGIKIKKAEDLDLTQMNSFIQEYISNPLLIDKRKFDIGIYTVITSANPLRVYTFDGEALLRFCPEDYHPFDPSNVNKYVVHDDYTPVWEMPSLKRYYTDLGFSRKEALNVHLRSIGKDPSKIWNQISETITSVLLMRQPLFIDLLQKYKYQWNFFEMSRFDFVVDEHLNVFLMEANMSPNLSSEHFPGNKLLYEQVIFNLLAVVGVGAMVHPDRSSIGYKDDLDMQVADKDLFVYAEQCADPKCASCESAVCKLCNQCMKENMKIILQHAFLEHVNRQSMRRIFPKPYSNGKEQEFQTYLSSLNNEQNRLMALWFKGKCLQDETWCS